VIVISGSRTFADRALVERVVAHLLAHHCKVLFGDAKSGVARFVREYIEGIRKARWTRYDADWQRFSRAAGHIRNGEMIRAGGGLVAIFADGPETPGTAGAVKLARRKGIPVRIFHEGWQPA